MSNSFFMISVFTALLAFLLSFFLSLLKGGLGWGVILWRALLNGGIFLILPLFVNRLFQKFFPEVLHDIFQNENADEDRYTSRSYRDAGSAPGDHESERAGSYGTELSSSTYTAPAENENYAPPADSDETPVQKDGDDIELLGKKHKAEEIAKAVQTVVKQDELG